MKNAFEILGATPSDSVERLKELFEEKQLFSDDDKEIELAYTELTNLKKRITHEIKYFSGEYFSEFDEAFSSTQNVTTKPNVIISNIISIGKWFDEGANKLIDTINEQRDIADFAAVSDSQIIDDAISTLKTQTITTIKDFLSNCMQESIITLFNRLVLWDDYMSFFVNDLLLHYENIISETIKKAEKDCRDAFARISNDANSYISDGSIDDNFIDDIEYFRSCLREWDKLVQPLQINYQNCGTNHPGSADFVHELRNDVIQMCNDSQKDLTDLMSRLRYDYSAKQELKDKILYASQFIQCLIYVLDILQDVFKEIEDTAERLKKDKKDFVELKQSVIELNDKINPFRSKIYLRPLRGTDSKPSSVSDTVTSIQGTSTSSYSNYSIDFSEKNNSTKGYFKRFLDSLDSEEGIKAMLWTIFIISIITMFFSDESSFVFGSIISRIIFFVVIISALVWHFSGGSIDFEVKYEEILYKGSIIFLIALGITFLISVFLYIT